MSELKPRVSFIIPVYNERGVFDQVYPAIYESLVSWNQNFELLIIDDGSNDGLSYEFCQNDSQTRVIKHKINMGNGASIKTGIRNAAADYCCIMDSDGQHTVEDALKLVNQLKEYDLIVGSRNFNNSGTLHRNFANRCFSSLASYMADFKIYDLTSGLRAFHKEKVVELIHLFPNRFSCPTTMTLGMIRLGYQVSFEPITVHSREGRSKIKIFQDGLKFLLIILKITTLFSPLRIFVPIAAFMFLLSLLNYIYIFFESHRFSVWSAVFFSCSVTVFMIGLVAEEISAMKLKRPDR